MFDKGTSIGSDLFNHTIDNPCFCSFVGGGRVLGQEICDDDSQSLISLILSWPFSSSDDNSVGIQVLDGGYRHVVLLFFR